MEQSSSWEADYCISTHVLHSIYEAQDLLQKPHSEGTSTSPYSERNKFSPHFFILHMSWDPFNIIRPSVPVSSSGLFYSGFLTRILYKFLFFSIHPTCLKHVILIDLSTLLVFCEVYEFWCFLLLNFLHSTLNSSLLCPHVLSNTFPITVSVIFQILYVTLCCMHCVLFKLHAHFVC